MRVEEEEQKTARKGDITVEETVRPHISVDKLPTIKINLAKSLERRAKNKSIGSSKNAAQSFD